MHFDYGWFAWWARKIIVRFSKCFSLSVVWVCSFAWSWPPFRSFVSCRLPVDVFFVSFSFCIHWNVNFVTTGKILNATMASSCLRNVTATEKIENWYFCHQIISFSFVHFLIVFFIVMSEDIDDNDHERCDRHDGAHRLSH